MSQVAVAEDLAGGVLAIDAGNSKTDVALVAADGTVIATARGAGFHPHSKGPAAAVTELAEVVATAARSAGLEPRPGSPMVEHVSACLANADLPLEEERVERVVCAHGWGRSTFVGNDTFALLRAGADQPRGVAVVCGAGINCVGLLPDGRTARFAAVGAISGDWGGGGHLAEQALWWAARAEDGRGPSTMLAQALPNHFGLATMQALIEGMHLGDIPSSRRHELVPVLFTVAAAGDEIAQAIVRRLAEEVVVLAEVALRRLDLQDDPVDVILGGGVLTARHELLLDTVEKLLKQEAPNAVVRVVSAPPVVGAALLGLDRIGATAAAQETLRACFRALAPVER